MHTNVDIGFIRKVLCAYFRNDSAELVLVAGARFTYSVALFQHFHRRTGSISISTAEYLV
jgi:hypothetical protein